jgi:hypothetical protein
MKTFFIVIKSTNTVPEKMHAQAVLEQFGLVGSRYPRTMEQVPEAIRQYFEAVPAA